jgi:hypothetical protein
MKALNGLFLRRNSPTFSPATERSFARNLGSPFGRHLRGPCLPAPASQLRRGTLGAIGFEFIGLLAGRDAHDLDGVAYHVGGALLASGASGHWLALEIGFKHGDRG